MRDVAVDRSATRCVRAVFGVLVAGAGAAALITATSTPETALARAGLGSLGLLVGAVVLGPVVARPAAAVLGAGPAALRGVTGRLARRNAMRNPRRTAASASALMVGTAVVGLFTTFGASIKASIDETVDDDFAGDLIVLPEGFSGSLLSPELAPAIAELPDVELGGRHGLRSDRRRRRHRRGRRHRRRRPRRRVRRRRDVWLARRLHRRRRGDQRGVRRRSPASPSARRSR